KRSLLFALTFCPLCRVREREVIYKGCCRVSRISLSVVMVVTILLFLLLLVLLDVMKPKGYPPVVGSYLWFRQEKSRLAYDHLVWSSLVAQYGPVAGVRLGKDKIVVASGYEAVKEVLLRDEFDGRPDGFFFRVRTFGKKMGVVFTEGPMWQEQRRFCVQHLRKLGLGTRSMEMNIEEEANDLVALFRKKCEAGNAVVRMHDAFDVCVLNSLWAILAGQRFALDDQRLIELLEVVHLCFRNVDPSGGLLNQMPFLRFIAPDRSGYTKLMENLNRMWNFFKEMIEDHRRTFSPECTRDLIDSFLQEMEVTKSHSNSSFQDLQLVSLSLDLFMAGSETTSNTLGFAMLYMLLYPDVQIQVQEELDKAVLMELQRHVNVAPSGIAHRALQNTVLMGHGIPQIYSIFGSSAGKRRCLGETLAKSSLFIFFSTLLHNFTVSVPSGHPLPSMEGYDGVTLSPKPFYAKLVARSYNAIPVESQLTKLIWNYVIKLTSTGSHAAQLDEEIVWTSLIFLSCVDLLHHFMRSDHDGAFVAQHETNNW
ncbi:Methyl farnesoate epoxidase, partial [Blattella germanica]